MFSQACVKNSVHGGGCVSQHALGQTPPTQCMLGYTPPGQTTPRADTPPPFRHIPHRRPLQRTVRILLECILVYKERRVSTIINANKHHISMRTKTNGRRPRKMRFTAVSIWAVFVPDYKQLPSGMFSFCCCCCLYEMSPFRKKRLEALLSVLQVFVCRSQRINGTNRSTSIKASSHRAKANVKVKKIKEQSEEKENFHFRVLVWCEWTLKALFTRNVYVGVNGNVSIRFSKALMVIQMHV